MADFLENLSKDIQYHCKNVEDFNKDVLNQLDKANRDLLESLGKTNQEIVDNLIKLLGVAPQKKPEKPSFTAVPRAYNPYE